MIILIHSPFICPFGYRQTSGMVSPASFPNDHPWSFARRTYSLLNPWSLLLVTPLNPWPLQRILQEANKVIGGGGSRRLHLRNGVCGWGREVLRRAFTIFICLLEIFIFLRWACIPFVMFCKRGQKGTCSCWRSPFLCLHHLLTIHPSIIQFAAESGYDWTDCFTYP